MLRGKRTFAQLVERAPAGLVGWNRIVLDRDVVDVAEEVVACAGLAVELGRVDAAAWRIGRRGAECKRDTGGQGEGFS